MTAFLADNLRRVMTGLGLTIDQVVDRTGLDRRTIKGILAGVTTPQAVTLHRLAEGLETSADEFFLAPSQLLYRHFDRRTNPIITEVVELQPELFADWTEADFEELHSRMGVGGPLTHAGTVAAAREMNRNRETLERVAVLLESSQAEVIRGMVDLMYEKAVLCEKAAGDSQTATAGNPPSSPELPTHPTLAKRTP
jgi:transcriptional regulator with XRE-family HTH domain